MIISARFNQSPEENKRYLLDYTAQLATGETVVSIAVNISSNSDPTNAGLFQITNVAITPAGNQAAFFATGGLDANAYNVQFLATTSLTQVFEDVAVFNVLEKLDN